MSIESAEWPLTPREKQVLGLLASTPMTLRQIAVSIGISVKTAEEHKANAYAKLGIHSRAELMLSDRATAPEATA